MCEDADARTGQDADAPEDRCVEEERTALHDRGSDEKLSHVVEESADGTDADERKLRVPQEEYHGGKARQSAREAVEERCDSAAEEGGEKDAQEEYGGGIAGARKEAERDEGDDGGKPKLCPRYRQRQGKKSLKEEENEGEGCEEGDARRMMKRSHVISLRSGVYAGGRRSRPPFSPRVPSARRPDRGSPRGRQKCSLPRCGSCSRRVRPQSVCPPFLCVP